jgi:hypothetical protein
VSKPTPGPWKLSEGDDWISVGPLDDAEPLLADMIGFKPNGPDEPACRSREECRANAVLMAAAPHLLVALKDARTTLAVINAAQCHAGSPLLNRIDAAIAKAEGTPE